MMNTKKLGFGPMRLPLTDPADARSIFQSSNIWKIRQKYWSRKINNRVMTVG